MQKLIVTLPQQNKMTPGANFPEMILMRHRSDDIVGGTDAYLFVIARHANWVHPCKCRSGFRLSETAMQPQNTRRNVLSLIMMVIELFRF